MRENTEYHGYDPNNPIIKAFWEIMEEMNQTQRAAFLQFVTGKASFAKNNEIYLIPCRYFEGPIRRIQSAERHAWASAIPDT